jgi:hypothetical protein
VLISRDNPSASAQRRPSPRRPDDADSFADNAANLAGNHLGRNTRNQQHQSFWQLLESREGPITAPNLAAECSNSVTQNPCVGGRH